jgi:hypothetical protein
MSTYRVWRDAWAKGTDGGAEWDGCTVGEPCATVDEALAIVAAQTDWARYTIQETPIRLRVPHPFAGRPEDARKRLQEKQAA